MKNLRELTAQESGIIVIIYNGQGALYNWGSTYGLPRIFPPNLIGCEEVPEVEGEHYDDLSGLLEGVQLNISAHYTDEELPKSGTVYQIGDITVIAPA